MPTVFSPPRADIRKERFAQNNSELDNVFEVLDDLKNSDPGAEVLLKSDNNKIKLLYIQTSSMKETFGKFPEVLLMDATYCINSHKMPLFVLMCMDGFGNGRIAAYCFVSDEHQDTVESVLKIFCDVNPSSKNLTKTVIVDKDHNEIAAIKAILPSAKVHLCCFHVLKVFKNETADKEPQASRESVRNIIEKMVHATSRDEYEEQYRNLLKVASPKFVSYFDNNWHNCKESWTNFDRVSRTRN